MLNLNQPDKKNESWDLLSILKKIENGTVAIAAYQRGKAWSNQQIQEYLEVILANNISIIPSLEGSIRNKKENKNDLIPIDNNYKLNNEQIIAIVDGQQRLTHLYLGIQEGNYSLNFKKIAYEIADTIKKEKKVIDSTLIATLEKSKDEKFLKINKEKDSCSLKIYFKEEKTSSVLFKYFLENLIKDEKLIKTFIKYFEDYRQEIINQKLNISIMAVSIETEKLCFRTSNTKGSKLTPFQVINSLSDGDIPFGYIIIKTFLKNMSNNDLDLFFKYFNLKDNSSLENEKRVEYIYRNSPNMSLEKFCRNIIQSEKIDKKLENIIVSEKEILSRKIVDWTNNLDKNVKKFLEALNALKEMRLFENKSDSITLFISYFMSTKYNKFMKETGVQDGFRFFYYSMAVQNTVFNFKNTPKLVSELRNSFHNAKDGYTSYEHNYNLFKNIIKLYDHDIDYALTSKAKSKKSKILQEILILKNDFKDITNTNIKIMYDIHHLIPEKCERNELFEDTIINCTPLFSKKNKKVASANLYDYLSKLDKNKYEGYQIPYIEKDSKNFEKIFLEKRKELLKNFFCNYFNVNSEN